MNNWKAFLSLKSDSVGNQNEANIINNFIYIALIVCINSTLWVNKHLAITNISLGVLCALLVIKRVLQKDFRTNYPVVVLLITLSSFFIAYLFVFIFGADLGSHYMFNKWIAWPQLALVFMLLPTYSFKRIRLVIITLLVNILLIDMYILIKYVDLIILKEGKTLPPGTNTNYIDVFEGYILPLGYIHLFIAVVNLVAIVFNAYLVESTKEFIKRILLFLTMFFFLAMVHFLGSRYCILTSYAFCISYLYKKYLNQFSPIIIVLFTSIFLIAVAVLVNGIPTASIKWAKLIEEFSYYYHSSYNDILHGPDYRLRGYFVSFQCLKEHPWGIGIDRIFELYGDNRWPLNSYLFMAMAYGIAFGILQLFLHTSLFYYYSFHSKFTFFAIWMALIFLTYSCIENVLWHRDSFYFLGTIIFSSIYFSRIELNQKL